MGSFNKAGFLSHLPIRRNDDIVILLCTLPPYNDTDYIAHPYYTNSQLNPFCLPIYGKYNDYGGITDVKHNYTVDLLEKVCGAKIEDIINAMGGNLDEFTPSPAKAVQRFDKYDYNKDSTEYKILTNLRDFIYKSILCRNADKFVILFEYADFFNDCCNDPIKDSIVNDLNTNVDIIKKFNDITHKDLFIHFSVEYDMKNRMVMHSYSMINEIDISKQNDIQELINQLKDTEHYFFNWHLTLPFYTMAQADYEKVEIDEIAKLAVLDRYMRHIHEHLTVPGDWGQCDDMTAKKKHYQKCIKFIKHLNDTDE